MPTMPLRVLLINYGIQENRKHTAYQPKLVSMKGMQGNQIVF